MEQDTSFYDEVDDLEGHRIYEDIGFMRTCQLPFILPKSDSTTIFLKVAYCVCFFALLPL